jgi:hypothetical protein
MKRRNDLNIIVIVVILVHLVKQLIKYILRRKTSNDRLLIT